MGKLRDFAEKLLKNIKKVEEWMQMRGNAMGKYMRGRATRMGRMDTNKAYYILYKVRVYVYAHLGVEEVDAMRAFRKSTGMTATWRRC